MVYGIVRRMHGQPTWKIVIVSMFSVYGLAMLLVVACFLADAIITRACFREWLRSFADDWSAEERLWMQNFLRSNRFDQTLGLTLKWIHQKLRSVGKGEHSTTDL
jgi:hypothetical protein